MLPISNTHEQRRRTGRKKRKRNRGVGGGGNSGGHHNPNETWIGDTEHGARRTTTNSGYISPSVLDLREREAAARFLG
jgi:hypothetical protein